MVVVFFFAGEASAEAVDVFLVVELELFLVVDVPCVVVALVVACGFSFFWAWHPTNAATASAVTKVKTDVFIELVKLNERENVDPVVAEQARKFVLFAFLISEFSLLIDG